MSRIKRVWDSTIDSDGVARAWHYVAGDKLSGEVTSLYAKLSALRHPWSETVEGLYGLLDAPQATIDAYKLVVQTGGFTHAWAREAEVGRVDYDGSTVLFQAAGGYSAGFALPNRAVFKPLPDRYIKHAEALIEHEAGRQRVLAALDWLVRNAGSARAAQRIWPTLVSLCNASDSSMAQFREYITTGRPPPLPHVPPHIRELLEQAAADVALTRMAVDGHTITPVESVVNPTVLWGGR